MTTRAIEAIVKKMPAAANVRQQQAFLRETLAGMTDRPYLVLDCSEVRELDKSTCYLLVCCLEEALIRSGDAVIAALPSGAERMLRQSGLARLFDVFATVADASRGFNRAAILLPTANTNNRAAQVQVQMLHEELQSVV